MHAMTFPREKFAPVPLSSDSGGGSSRKRHSTFQTLRPGKISASLREELYTLIYYVRSWPSLSPRISCQIVSPESSPLAAAMYVVVQCHLKHWTSVIGDPLCYV